MAPEKRTFFQYSEDDMRSAIEELVSDPKKKVRCVVKKYNIPHPTLLRMRKMKKGVVTHNMGPSTVFTTEEEELLVKWTLVSAKKGIPLKKPL